MKGIKEYLDKFVNKSRVVAVLGCGPAGLFAAHALIERGWEVEILSNKRRSEMFGAQYLHQYIPGLTNSAAITVNYRLRGTGEGYKQKVYGDAPVEFVSPDSLPSVQEAWDIRETYYRAWDLYKGLIIHTPGIGPAEVESVLLSNRYRSIVSSLPARDLCARMHQFRVKRIWAIGDAPERGIECPVRVDKNTVVCDGTNDVGWYRASNVYGYSTCEWPYDRKPPVPGVSEVLKPIGNDCNCWISSGRFYRTGRYGCWEKHVYAHQSYWDTKEELFF